MENYALFGHQPKVEHLRRAWVGHHREMQVGLDSVRSLASFTYCCFTAAISVLDDYLSCWTDKNILQRCGG
jgi:hypothetical protein